MGGREENPTTPEVGGPGSVGRGDPGDGGGGGRCRKRVGEGGRAPPTLVLARQWGEVVHAPQEADPKVAGPRVRLHLARGEVARPPPGLHGVTLP